jgi:hypothetical protein
LNSETIHEKLSQTELRPEQREWLSHGLEDIQTTSRLDLLVWGLEQVKWSGWLTTLASFASLVEAKRLEIDQHSCHQEGWKVDEQFYVNHKRRVLARIFHKSP